MAFLKRAKVVRWFGGLLLCVTISSLAGCLGAYVQRRLERNATTALEVKLEQDVLKLHFMNQGSENILCTKSASYSGVSSRRHIAIVTAAIDSSLVQYQIDEKIEEVSKNFSSLDFIEFYLLTSGKIEKYIKNAVIKESASRLLLRDLYRSYYCYSS